MLTDTMYFRGQELTKLEAEALLENLDGLDVYVFGDEIVVDEPQETQYDDEFCM